MAEEGNDEKLTQEQFAYLHDIFSFHPPQPGQESYIRRTVQKQRNSA